MDFEPGDFILNTDQNNTNYMRKLGSQEARLQQEPTGQKALAKLTQQ